MPASASFWQSPYKTVARRWLFNIHFYCGLIAGLLWVVTGVTGSVIVFVPELRRLEVPGWTRVQPAGQRLPLEALANRILTERPGDTLVNIQFDFKPAWGLNFRTVNANGERVHTFLDQYRGQILGSVNYHRSALQWIYDLHSDLQGGPLGRKANAWSAFALCLAMPAGMLLWWRGRREWKRGFEYRSGASWKQQIWDLHSLAGFFFFLPLLLLCVSGAYYAYEPAFASVTAALTGGPAEIPPPKIISSGGQRRSLDEILESAQRALPDSQPSQILFPQRPDEPFTLRMRRASDLHRIGLNWLYVDPVSARVLRVDRFDRQPLGVKIIRLMTPLHYGTFGGAITQVLWVVVGLIPGGLFVTSVLMWWNRSLVWKWRRARRAAEQELAANLPPL